MSFQVLDVNHDGTRRVFRVDYQETVDGSVIAGGMVEVRISASGAAGFKAELVVVATWSQVQFATLSSSKPDVDPNTHTRFWWDSASGSYVSGTSDPLVFLWIRGCFRGVDGDAAGRIDCCRLVRCIRKP